MPYKDKEKQKEYQRKWVAKRRAEWFAENGPCIECGTWDNLELDHINPELKVEHRIWSWTEARRVEELAKCVAKCKSCHAAKSVNEHAKGTNHGQNVLTPDEVLEIRRIKQETGVDNQVLAEQFGVVRGTIWYIVNRKTWQDI